MSKYDPLRHHLFKAQGNRWVASFSDIEAVLGFRLPDSARKYPAWWANESGNGNHSHARAWLNTGWKTAELDLSRDQVTFARDTAV